jgi:hypothetical protein
MRSNPIENRLVRLGGRLMALMLGAALAGGCERKAEDGAEKPTTQKPEADVLIFPKEIHTADPTVNAFVAEAMRTCVSGEYEPFRLLWSADVTPMPRERFENHWQAVERIHVRGLEKDPREGSEVYAVYADLSLDPEQLPPQHELHDNPRRSIVLLIVREHDEWRLNKASKEVRAWMAQKVQAGDGVVPDSD